MCPLSTASGSAHAAPGSSDGDSAGTQQKAKGRGKRRVEQRFRFRATRGTSGLNKSEIRNPKQSQNSKKENSKPEGSGPWLLGFWSFEFVSDFGFRHSNLSQKNRCAGNTFFFWRLSAVFSSATGWTIVR